jgi:DNA-binding transcriptional ArsR family regulator
LAHKLLVKDELLENQLRERIMDLLVQSPGCYLGKMGRELEVPTSTLKYHLNILRSFDMVTTVKKGRCRHYFPKRRRFTDHEKRMFAALEHAPTRRMVEIVREHPDITQAGLVQRTGLSQSTVAWHMGKLEEMTLVESVRRGVKEYRLTPEFAHILAVVRGEVQPEDADAPPPPLPPEEAEPARAEPTGAPRASAREPGPTREPEPPRAFGSGSPGEAPAWAW